MIGGGFAGQNVAKIGERRRRIRHCYGNFPVISAVERQLSRLGLDGRLVLTQMMVADHCKGQGKSTTAAVDGG